MNDAQRAMRAERAAGTGSRAVTDSHLHLTLTRVSPSSGRARLGDRVQMHPAWWLGRAEVGALEVSCWAQPNLLTAAEQGILGRGGGSCLF